MPGSPPIFTLGLDSALRSADWFVLALYAALLVGAGWWFSRRGASTTRGYFLADGRMPVWAVAISMLATVQSAATFVGVPEDAMQGDLTYLSTNIGGLIASCIVAYCFIPVYYRLGVSTPYQLLETRFGPGAKVAASGMYLIGRVFATGARIYVGAIPVALALFGDISPHTLVPVIAAFMIFAFLFTLRGGLTSVIWTDILQVGVYMGAAIVAGVLLWTQIPASPSEVLDALGSGGANGSSKVRVLELGFGSGGIDFTKPFTLLTAVTGWTLLMLAAFGTDQDLTQRLLTCPDARRGARSTIASVLVGIPAVMIFSGIGLLLWVIATRPDLMGRPTPAHLQGEAKGLLVAHALREMPGGVAGLLLAGVLAAGPAGVNASLNSMAGTFINDFYKPLLAPGRSEAHYIRTSRMSVGAWALILGMFAVVCIWWQRASGENIINFVLGVMTFAYAGLLGVFLTAIFTKRGSAVSAITAMVVGFCVIFLMQPSVWNWWTALVDAEHDVFPKMNLASPWRLVIGAAAATCVCLLARGRGGRA
jgi:SSS family transporter